MCALPSEMRAAIFDHLDRARDVVALYIASRAVLTWPLAVEVAKRLKNRKPWAVLAAGAPLGVLQHLKDKDGFEAGHWPMLARTLLGKAVSGGHLDVVRWLCTIGDIINTRTPYIYPRRRLRAVQPMERGGHRRDTRLLPLLHRPDHRQGRHSGPRGPRSRVASRNSRQHAETTYQTFSSRRAQHPTHLQE